MIESSLKNEINQMDKWRHKLIFLCNRNDQFKSKIPLTDSFEKINVNYVISKGLLNITKKDYPFYVEEILNYKLTETNDIYLLQHLDILFDPTIQIHAVRLLENLSKTYKLVVEWPGRYEYNCLNYAEYGHPEYFSCRDFEGKVILK